MLEHLGQNYEIILADPPWTFETRSDKGKGKSPERHYATMTLDDICALPVAECAAKDAVLFLWSTWPTIFRAEKVIEAWGFKYSGLAWEWLKYNSVTEKFAFGPGYGTRKNVEPCLLARRGSPKLLSRSERDFILAPRREHSRKPDEQYDKIGNMYQGKKVELFATQDRQYWHTWSPQRHVEHGTQS
jgi:N6-adenosine-specific RNA methylase IME4